jgi:hypothetical protein
LSILPGNARIHAPIWVKVGAPVTKDWGICGFRLSTFGAKALDWWIRHTSAVQE